MKFLTKIIPLMFTIIFFLSCENDDRNDEFVDEEDYMILVSSGSFTMGDYYNEGQPDELPLHSVYLDSFYISRYEITQGEWVEYMPHRLYYFGKGDNYPVYKTSWYDILVYCNLRSIDEGLDPCYNILSSTDPNVWGDIPAGQDNSTWDSVICNWNANGYRLPTEAEWEKAAKGGKYWSDNYRYSGGNNVDSVAWYGFLNNQGNAEEHCYPVGLKQANQLDIYDMSGNIYEWCWDLYGSYPNESLNNPHGSDVGSDRIVRGGNWHDYSTNCRVSNRFNASPYERGDDIGFRIVRGKK